jgi:hypothetical protein
VAVHHVRDEPTPIGSPYVEDAIPRYEPPVMDGYDGVVILDELTIHICEQVSAPLLN